MSSFDVLDIAASGLTAQSIRLNTIASNLANAQSASSTEANVYRAKQPIFETQLLKEIDKFGNEALGVKVKEIIQSDRPVTLQYEPNHPQANEEGYVYYPNVNVVEEMANMISASRTYQSNVNIINTTKTLLQRTLQLGQ